MLPGNVFRLKGFLPGIVVAARHYVNAYYCMKGLYLQDGIGFGKGESLQGHIHSFFKVLGINAS